MSEIYVQVKVEEGILRGQQKTSEGLTKNKYYAFQGIPFAKPPVGELRFKPPQPADPWDGVRDVLKDGSQSIQQVFGLGLLVGSEDCLYLNVHTHELLAEGKKLKPVLFHVHGGGFSAGNGGSEMYDPDYFLDHDIVFVSPNYRCGALGFLSLQNDEISGNAGLKDQVQALKWTRRNIKQFGGDPDNITIMGLSAGGASTEYLLLTELTRGLFKRAIIQSGSTLNTWSFNDKPREFANRLAQKLGYTGSIQDDTALQKFFNSCTAEEIVKNQNEILTAQEKVILHCFAFAPCVEKEGKKGEKFITRYPREILQSGDFAKVPVIIGFVNSEGCLYFFGTTPTTDDFEEMNKHPDYLLPLNLNVPQNKRTELGKEVMKFYFGNKPVSWGTIDSLVELIGDLTFVLGISEAEKYIIETSESPVYCYGVSYETINSSIKSMLTMRHTNIQPKGVAHGGDLEFMFKFKVPGFPVPEPATADKKYIKIITTMLTEFAKTGNPNYNGMDFPKWQPSVLSDTQYFNIGDELKMVPGRMHEERITFWEDIYSKYGYSF